MVPLLTYWMFRVALYRGCTHWIAAPPAAAVWADTVHLTAAQQSLNFTQIGGRWVDAALASTTNNSAFPPELRFAEIDVAPLVSRRAAQLFAGKVREREAARRARRRREDAARARVEREERRRPLPTALPTVHPSVASSPPPSLLFSLPCPLL